MQQTIEPWSLQARLAIWDWTKGAGGPVEEAYLPPHPGERSLSEIVARATSGKSSPGPGARVEIQDGSVFIFRHEKDTNPKKLGVGDATLLNFTKPRRHTVGVKVASVIRAGPNGEIATA